MVPKHIYAKKTAVWGLALESLVFWASIYKIWAPWWSLVPLEVPKTPLEYLRAPWDVLGSPGGSRGRFFMILGVILGAFGDNFWCFFDHQFKLDSLSDLGTDFRDIWSYFGKCSCVYVKTYWETGILGNHQKTICFSMKFKGWRGPHFYVFEGI